MNISPINNNSNYNRPNFKANLLLSGETLESCLERNNISSKQVKMIQDKFAKKTKLISGNMCLYFGKPDDNGINKHCGQRITYHIPSKRYQDSLPVAFVDSNMLFSVGKVSFDNAFVDKLVKILDIFQTRKRNAQEVLKLEKQAKALNEKISELRESTEVNSLNETKKHFNITHDYAKLPI